MKPNLILVSLLLAVSSTFSQAQESTFTVTSAKTQSLFTLEGKVEAVQEATISAQTSGQIQAISFDVNDYVEQGAVIIQLRDRQQKAALEQAQAALTQAQAANTDAQAKLEQSTPLFAQGSLSKGQMDTIQANAKSSAAAVKAAKASLKQAQENYSYTQIKAPYSGIVKARLVEVGESVAPGTPLMTGLSLSKLRVTADIPQRFAPHIQDKSAFKVLHQAQVIEPQKVTVFPYADPNSHSFKVRVDINAEGSKLFPGMWVKLQVPMGEETTITVPSSALIRRGELSAVYVERDGEFHLRQVRPGKQRNDKLEVLAGLRDGEKIAIDAYAVMAQKERN